MRRKRPAAPMTVSGLIREGARRLRAAGVALGHGTTNAGDESAWLTLHALGHPPGAAVVASQPVTPAAARRARALIGRRIRSRKPAAYLTREAWLGGLSFRVDERVIVPRSHLADPILEGLAPWIPDRRGVRAALDLCTGSGCLAILLARAFPGARVDAADLSAGALEVARINVRRYRLGSRIRPVRSDLYSALRGRRYDLIVCNPPYVPGAAMRRLPREYRHEPRLALAGGRDGLDLVRRVLAHAARHLRPGGLLLMEVGRGRARVQRAFPRTEFTWLETPGGGDVLLAFREQLKSPAHRAPAPRTAPAPRAAAARRTGRA